MLTFEEPLWFILLPLLLFLLWLRFFWRRRGNRISFPHRIWGGEGLRAPQPGLRMVLFLASLFTWGGTVLLITAMAGPQRAERRKIQLSRGIDIMIVLDQSPSMGAMDFSDISRFDEGREMIRRFVTGRTGDAIGLVSFGSEARLQSPPTVDYDWLMERLDALKIQDLGNETAMGMGLAVALLHLSDSKASQKVIVLLTDGDDNAGEIRPETAVALAARQGIRVYAVGIGNEGETSIELVDPETGAITRGNIRTRFDEQRLRSLAETTGGGYWRVTSPGALEMVMKTVDSLESVEKRVSLQVVSRPLHRPMILAGGILILFAFLIRKGLFGEIP